jgi:hypothetical protein
MHLHTYPSLLLELDETHHFCTCLSLPHTHTSLSLSLSLSPPLPLPLSLSQLKNLPGILRNPKIRAGIYFIDNLQFRFLYIISGSENCPVSLGCLGEELESKNLRVFLVLDLVD